MAAPISMLLGFHNLRVFDSQESLLFCRVYGVFKIPVAAAEGAVGGDEQEDPGSGEDSDAGLPAGGNRICRNA